MEEEIEEKLQEIFEKKNVKIEVKYFELFKYKILVKKENYPKSYVYLYYYNKELTLNTNIELIANYINKVIIGGNYEYKSFRFIRT